MEYSVPTEQSFPTAPESGVRVTSKDVFWAFLAITLLGLGLIYAMQDLLVNDDLYFNSWAKKFTADTIQESIDRAHRWAWVVYTIIPVSNLIRFTCVAGCLALGYYFTTNRWAFKPFFWVAIQAELVLLVPILLKIIWFLGVHPQYHLEDLQNFYPLSLASVVDYSALAAWQRYPAQLLNLFELAYWFVLAYGIKQALSLPVSQALRLVASSYGAALVLWIAFVMFTVITFS